VSYGETAPVLVRSIFRLLRLLLEGELVSAERFASSAGIPVAKPNAWILPGAAAALGLGLLVAGTLTASFDARHPKPNNIVYALSADTQTAIRASAGPTWRCRWCTWLVMAVDKATKETTGQYDHRKVRDAWCDDSNPMAALIEDVSYAPRPDHRLPRVRARRGDGLYQWQVRA
jgi:hypothetical protein